MDTDIRVFHPGSICDLTPCSEINFIMNSGETATGVVLEIVYGIAEVHPRNLYSVMPMAMLAAMVPVTSKVSDRASGFGY